MEKKKAKSCSLAQLSDRGQKSMPLFKKKSAGARSSSPAAAVAVDLSGATSGPNQSPLAAIDASGSATEPGAVHSRAAGAPLLHGVVVLGHAQTSALIGVCLLEESRDTPLIQVDAMGQHGVDLRALDLVVFVLVKLQEESSVGRVLLGINKSLWMGVVQLLSNLYISFQLEQFDMAGGIPLGTGIIGDEHLWCDIYLVRCEGC
mmetsp:Transcript_3788/g.8828  ORF Transcript_3788/g.8828 Transcript_3788/m.8828 type:complete len:204 (-) Transcript_3788:152-763(-)